MCLVQRREHAEGTTKPDGSVKHTKAQKEGNVPAPVFKAGFPGGDLKFQKFKISYQRTNSQAVAGNSNHVGYSEKPTLPFLTKL